MTPATILVLDPNERSLAQASSLLGQDGTRVLTARTIEAAESLVDSEPISLILIELNLPEISGHDYADYLREARNVRAPIVLWSSVNPARLGALVAESGCAGAIRKDIEMSSLILDVRKFLPRPEVRTP